MDAQQAVCVEDKRHMRTSFNLFPQSSLSRGPAFVCTDSRESYVTPQVTCICLTCMLHHVSHAWQKTPSIGRLRSREVSFGQFPWFLCPSLLSCLEATVMHVQWCMESDSLWCPLIRCTLSWNAGVRGPVLSVLHAEPRDLSRNGNQARLALPICLHVPQSATISFLRLQALKANFACSSVGTSSRQHDYPSCVISRCKLQL